MFKKITFLGLLALFLNLPKASAALPLSVEDIPPAVDADIYTITVNTEPGAKVTVTGGTSQLPPTTDTDEDGVLEITVGLIQNKENTFSILAEKAGSFSETLQIKINENTAEAGNYAQSSGKDITPPNRPILDDYEDELDAKEITLTGVAEANSKLIATKTDGTELASTNVNDDGTFSIKVELAQNQTNRINLFAKDDAGNTSTAIQAVIAELGEAIDEDDQASESETNQEEASDIAAPFTDIANHWGKEYINKLRIAGIVGGKNEGIFAPNDYLTRAELTKIALNAFDINVGDVSEKPFEDVNLQDWFAAYVKTAKEEGIVKGYQNVFRPNQNVTRAEALKILLTTANFDLPAASTDFSDVAAGAWHEKYIAFAKDNEIVGGYKDGTFKPNQPITRAEIAKITVKTMEVYDAKMIKEEEDKDEEKNNTGTGSDLIGENRLYENTNFDFSLQYYKNWYYEGITGTGDTVIKVGFSTDQDAIDNAEATLELKEDSLDDLGKKNLDYEKVATEIRYFLEYDKSRHIEIYGSTDYEGQIKTMAETLELEK